MAGFSKRVRSEDENYEEILLKWYDEQNDNESDAYKVPEIIVLNPNMKLIQSYLILK